MLQAAELTIRLHPDDDVVIARARHPGRHHSPQGEGRALSSPSRPGHKVAVRDIAQGEPVRRYNQIIGFATRAIAPGEHVHVHNLAMGDFARDYAFGADASRPRTSSARRRSRASSAPTGGSRRATTSAS